MRQIIIAIALVLASVPAFGQENCEARVIYFSADALSAVGSWIGYGTTPRPHIVVYVPHCANWDWVVVTFELKAPTGETYSQVAIRQRSIGQWVTSTVFAHYVAPGTQLLKVRVIPLSAGPDLPMAQ